MLVHGKELPLSVRCRPGRKPALLFVHALGSAKESFEGFWDQPLLAEQAAYAVDLPGFGASGEPADFPYSLEAFAEALEAFLSHEDVREVVVVGHSMGGAIGLLLAERLGAACRRGLVSLEGNLFPSNCVTSRQAARFSEDDFLHGGFEVVRHALEQQPGPASASWRQTLAECSPLAFHRASVSLVQWCDSLELARKFERLSCPKAYFFGRPNRALADFKALEGKFEAVHVADAGHFLMLDNPKEFYGKLAETVQAYL